MNNACDLSFILGNNNLNTKNTAMVKPSIILASIVCGLASLFYLYEFSLQVSVAVMTHQLMHAFATDALGLGIVSSAYYFAYTPMQLPAGVLYDRFGPRRLITIAILVCAAGAVFFGLSTNLFMAGVGRFLMGAGSAFSFIGALLLISRWFSTKHFALVAGITQLMSSIGAISGQIPLAAAVDKFGWRHSIIVMGVIGVVLAFIIWFAVRDQPPWRHTDEIDVHTGSIYGLKNVLAKAQTWFIALYSFASWAPILVFAGLWGIAYLSARYHISMVLASSAMAMVWLGIGIGSPLVGWWSDFMGRRNIPLVLVQILGLVSIFFILYIPHVSFVAMYVFLFLMGFAASGQSLAFGVVKDINPSKFVGTAIGFNNMAVVAGGFLLQPLASHLLKQAWNGKLVNNTPVYSIHAYQHAMSILPVCYIVCLLIGMVFIRETYCKDIHAVGLQPKPAN